MRKSEKEALQAMLDDEKETIKALEKAYQRALRRIRATGRGLQLPVRGADKGEVGAGRGRVADHEGQGEVLRAGQDGGVQGV